MRRTLIIAGVLALALLSTGVAQAATTCDAVTISGPSNVYAESSCVKPTWSAACSCPFGQTPKYSWIIDGSYAGSGSSASRLYCPQTPAQAYTMTVEVTITCGRSVYSDEKSVFVSLCDNSSGTPVCLG